MVGAVLLHGDGALKGPVPNGQGDFLAGSLLDQLAHLVRVVAGNHLTIDLDVEARGEDKSSYIGR